jgi:hypothetical protein
VLAAVNGAARRGLGEAGDDIGQHPDDPIEILGNMLVERRVLTGHGLLPSLAWRRLRASQAMVVPFASSEVKPAGPNAPGAGRNTSILEQKYVHLAALVGAHPS